MQSMGYKKIIWYDIISELQNQDKQVIICKVLAYIWTKGKEEADEAATKQAIDMHYARNNHNKIILLRRLFDHHKV